MIGWFKRGRAKRLTPDEVTVMHLREMFEALPRPGLQDASMIYPRVVAPAGTEPQPPKK